MSELAEPDAGLAGLISDVTKSEENHFVRTKTGRLYCERSYLLVVGSVLFPFYCYLGFGCGALINY